MVPWDGEPDGAGEHGHDPFAERRLVGDATFSCAADGYWMLCTCFTAAMWLVAAIVTAQRVWKNRSESFFEQADDSRTGTM
jgi:hypothetical protein